ncbi:hypothetical protein INR49_017069 [Caranx melampygus]|nr:hypothetical protein INR49_017069 [Caranx melampygus]
MSLKTVGTALTRTLWTSGSRTPLFPEPLKLTDFLPQVGCPGGDSRASKTLKNKVAARTRTGRGRTCNLPARLLRDGRLQIRRDPRSLWALVGFLV